MVNLKTQSNNYLVSDIPNLNGDNKYNVNISRIGYFDSTGNFIREASYGEWEWLYSLLTGSNPNQDCWIVQHPSIGFVNMFEFPPQRVGNFEQDFEETISEDYSDYDSRLCNNGGKYGYWTKRHYGTIIIDGDIYAAYYDTQHTTADFTHCESCGSFNEHGYNNMFVMLNDEKLFTPDVYSGCENELILISKL